MLPLMLGVVMLTRGDADAWRRSDDTCAGQACLLRRSVSQLRRRLLGGAQLFHARRVEEEMRPADQHNGRENDHQDTLPFSSDRAIFLYSKFLESRTIFVAHSPTPAVPQLS